MPRRPSPGNLSDRYGWRIHPITGRRQFHEGLDIGWVGGLTLVAPANGTVVAYDWRGGWGKRLDFRDDEGNLHYLAHTEELWASVGVWVTEGTPLAKMGATGNVEGVHLHWEVRPGGGSTIDPEEWLHKATPASSATTNKSEEDNMPDNPDSMFAIVDGVPSWCWLSWSQGTVYAVHTQEEADWISTYMGSVRMDLRYARYNGQQVTDGGSSLYKNKLALFGTMCPSYVVQGNLTEVDLAKIKKMIDAAPKTPAPPTTPPKS